MVRSPPVQESTSATPGPNLAAPADSEACGPEAGKQTDGGCLGDLFILLSQTHMLEILSIFIWKTKGAVRFVELQDKVGISPNTLSARLKALVAAGLVTRTPFNTIPPRVDYEATAKAHRLKKVFRSLHEWAQENALTPGEEPQVAVAVRR